MKKFVLFLAVVGLMIGLIGCQAQNELVRFQRGVNQTIETTDTFEDANLETLNQALLTSSHVSVMSYGAQIDLETDEKIAQVQSLISEIVSMRFSNYTKHQENVLNFETLKAQIDIFLESEYTLSNDDRLALRAMRLSLNESRSEVQATIGLVRALGQEVRANFNLESIDLVILKLTEMKDIITLRSNHILLVEETLSRANEMVLSYIEQA
jgi:hypothetical protein